MNVLSSSSRSSRIYCTLRKILSSGFPVLVATLTLSFSVPIHAQIGRAGLITGAVREDRRVVLHGNTHPLATLAADRGVVDASMPADRMLLVLRRSPERELALRSVIESLHDKNSPNFHKWMTPAQFGVEWGPADSDVAAVTAWLQSHGFQVAGMSAGRTAIEFSGTAGQVQQAFHTSIHSYFVNGELHHANAKDPEIPAALAPVVAGITTLNDFHPKAMVQKGPRGIFDQTTHKIRKQYTDPEDAGFLYLVPADAATIYNTPNQALNPAYAGATIDGRNAKIGVLSDANISKQQVLNYRSLFGLSAKSPTVIIDGDVDPGINGDTVEAYLDLEVAGGLAPGASLYLYTAADSSVNFGLDLASLRAVNDNLVDVLNMSFGGCEGGLSTSVNLFYEGLWEQAAAQGISVTVSTGDSGSAACDDPNKQTLAYYGLQVNGFASTPFNIAVGGTDFAPLATNSGFDSYVSQTNAPGTYRSAKSYIPESTWNDTSYTYPPGNLGNATAITDSNANIVAGGGGKSNCSAGYFLENGTLNCQYGYQKPSWQSALTPADQARDLPDVSLFAANGLYGAAWAICTDQDSLPDLTPIQDCTKNSDGLTNGEFYVYGVGGTSASAPAFAGILALLHQSTGERQGLANYVLYNLANLQQNNNTLHYFHDVVSGNNSVPCARGYANCKLDSAGSYYVTGYDAATGYDLATGLGSVDTAALIAGWASAGLTSTTTQLHIAPTSIEHGEKIVAKGTVTTSGGIATGDVALSANANPSASFTGANIGIYSLLGDGTTGNISINDLPGGTYNLIASYGGSEQFSQSISSPVTVTVAPEPSKTIVTFTSYSSDSGAPSSSATVPYGDAVNFTAHVYGIHSPVVGGVVQPDGIATGNVTFTSGSTNFGTDPLSLLGYALSDGHQLEVGAYPISANYHGDESFKPSTGATKLVITKAATQLSLTASATKYTGIPIVFRVKLTTISSGAAPTGQVRLQRGSVTLVQAPIVGVAATTSNLAEGSVSFSTSNLGTGTAPITAVYVGDLRYAASTSNGVEVGLPEPSKTIVTFASNNSGSGAPSSSALVPYGDAVTFTAHVYGSNSPVVGGVVQPDGIATGNVTFTSGKINFGTDPLNSLGYALSAGHLLKVGTYPILATYHGDVNFKPSTGVNKLVVTKAATQLSLIASATKYTGIPIVFRVKLTTGSSGAAPTGQVRLQRGSVILVQAPIVGVAATTSKLAEGSVSFSTLNLGIGTAPITAVYAGDLDYASSTSNGVQVEGRPTFTIGNISMTLPSEHSTGGGFLPVTSQNGYSGTINFTCALTSKTTTPTPAECTMLPSSIDLATGKVGQAQILIFGKGTKLPSSDTQSSNNTPSLRFKISAGGAVLACCLLVGIPARRRGWRPILSAVSVLLLLAAVAGLTACIATPKKISAGGYTFRVTGRDSKDNTNLATATVKVNVL